MLIAYGKTYFRILSGFYLENRFIETDDRFKLGGVFTDSSVIINSEKIRV